MRITLDGFQRYAEYQIDGSKLSRLFFSFSDHSEGEDSKSLSCEILNVVITDSAESISCELSWNIYAGLGSQILEFIEFCVEETPDNEVEFRVASLCHGKENEELFFVFESTAPSLNPQTQTLYKLLTDRRARLLADVFCIEEGRIIYVQ